MRYALVLSFQIAQLFAFYLIPCQMKESISELKQNIAISDERGIQRYADISSKKLPCDSSLIKDVTCCGPAFRKNLELSV